MAVLHGAYGRGADDNLRTANHLCYDDAICGSWKVLADDCMPIGQAIVRPEGADVTVTVHSRMVGHALKAAAILAEQGISVEVVDLRSLRPPDSATIVKSVIWRLRQVMSDL